MARRIVKSGVKVSAKAGRAGSSKIVVAEADKKMRAQVHEIPLTRQLLTITPEDPCWETRVAPIGGMQCGFIVRLRPPADVTDETLSKLKKDLIDAGAAAVRVLPRAQGQLVAHVEPGNHSLDAGRTVRQVVMDRARAVKSVNHDKLFTILDWALNKAAL